ncbi:hypothetical protein [Nocardia terpenica]|uniref:hypothetical protein n=1 Tax=Nocardia terpenica TaxID=455432 RepID=UPI0015C564E6|nr:hypothetical protein [Nocardia terpenica]NQE86627.1 hypothetical protein [Nocardia terpenica]
MVFMFDQEEAAVERAGDDDACGHRGREHVSQPVGLGEVEVCEKLCGRSGVTVGESDRTEDAVGDGVGVMHGHAVLGGVSDRFSAALGRSASRSGVGR